MKKHLFLFAIILTPFLSIAQSFEIDEPMTEITGTLANTTLEAHWGVVNTSSMAITTKVSREMIQEVEGSRNNFCWGIQCYGFGTDESPIPSTIQAGAADDTFHGYYEHQENLGTTIIEYCFFDQDNVQDKTCVTTTFIISNANDIANYKNDIELKSVAPNPVVGLSNFTYSIPGNPNNARVVIYNMVGSMVKDIPLSSNKGVVVIDGRDFEVGVYFYSLIIDGQNTATKRMIVAR